MSDISSAARDVLAASRIDGNVLYLPPGQLQRSLYEEVNEVLTRLGCKWKGGKVSGHVFDSAFEPSTDLAIVVQTCMMPPKNPTAFFATPPDIIREMLRMLRAHMWGTRIPQDARFLEPSAGKGAIAKAWHTFLIDLPGTLHVCEIHPVFAAYLKAEGFDVVANDFLTYTPEPLYHGILMNPPFSVEGDRQAYVTHILHAWELLAPGGILVAIAPPGFTFEERREKKLRNFLAIVEEHGFWRKLPEGSFKESGTGINTVLISMTKPRVQEPPEPEPVRPTLTLVPKEIPVFGDPNWIAQARTGSRRRR